MTPSESHGTHDQVAAYVERRTGLSFAGAQGRRFRQAVARTLPEDQRQRGGATEPLSAETFASLCEALTVQESYFFREPAKLALVKEHVLPGVRQRRAPVRVWSAGCAAGEEAYTLAAMLTEVGLGGRYRILGTDLSEEAVAAARRGSYTRWSVRGLGAEPLARLFEVHGSRYRVVDRYRADVTFEQHNLLDPRPESWGPFDLVLCRNVLIYFTPTAARAAVEALRDSLRPGGWLVLGVSDPLADDVPGLEPFVTEHGLAYRRLAADDAVAGAPVPEATPRVLPTRGGQGRHRTVRPAPAASTPRVATTPREVGRRLGAAPGAPDESASGDGASTAVVPMLVAAEEALALALPAEAERLVRGVLRVSPADRSAHLVLVQALAEQARTRDAVRAAERAVALFPEDGKMRHLLAVALLERGDAEAATVAARQAVYLEPALAPAHLVLARAQELLGDAVAARRSRRIGSRLLTEAVDR